MWSGRTLIELADFYTNIRKKPASTSEQYVRLVAGMFPDAKVKAVRVKDAPLASDRFDQHVVNAALLSGANYLVTDNTRDFPKQELKARGVEVVTPDAFLMELMQERGDEMVEILCIYAEYGSQPPADLEEVLKRLDRSNVPVFAESLRRRLS